MTNQETQQEMQTTQEQATEEKVEYKGEVVTRIEEEYRSYIDAIFNIKYKLENGYYTKKAITDVIYNLFVR